MLWIGNRRVARLWIGDKAVAALYCGAARVWEAISSCFGSGRWRSAKPWRGAERWKRH